MKKLLLFLSLIMMSISFSSTEVISKGGIELKYNLNEKESDIPKVEKDGQLAQKGTPISTSLEGFYTLSVRPKVYENNKFNIKINTGVETEFGVNIKGKYFKNEEKQKTELNAFIGPIVSFSAYAGPMLNYDFNDDFSLYTSLTLGAGITTNYSFYQLQLSNITPTEVHDLSFKDNPKLEIYGNIPVRASLGMRVKYLYVEPEFLMDLEMGKDLTGKFLFKPIIGARLTIGHRDF